jgi:predicted nucleic acid-binding protein
VDTNILAYTKDNRVPGKQATAAQWIDALVVRDAIVLSAQSLREYYAVSLRRDASPAAVQDARWEVSRYALFVPAALEADRLQEAWSLQDRFGFGLWNSLLLAAALRAGCSYFLSEDLQARQTIDAITVLNPFAETPQAIFGAP